MLVSSYRSMLSWYEKMAPMQDKIFKFMQREINDIDETERWKLEDDDEDPNSPYI